MTRGETKRILRQATRLRIEAERRALKAVMKWGPATEATALKLLQNVPSVFAIAEDLNKKYHRPLWASQRYGAR